MDLLFLGRGGAFNYNEKNNSAYFIDRDELFLIDCGESVFSCLVDKKIFDPIKCVNVFITHTHSDHVGSLGSLIMYCYFVIHKKVNIILSKDSLYEDDIINLIRIFGCTSDMYSIFYDLFYDNKYCFDSVRYVKTNHVSEIPSYGILFNTSDGVIYYSGDTSDLTNLNNIISSGVSIYKIYMDCTSVDCLNNVHVYIGELASSIPEDLKCKVYCMHFNNSECVDMALKYGFNVV